MKIVIGEMIRNLRKIKGISQEALAEVAGVSVQAVSKWECEASYPEITLIPRIAEYFNVPVGYLMAGDDGTMGQLSCDMPDDDVLRIVQFQGNKLISKDVYNPDIRIMLKIDEKSSKQTPLKVEIWGSVDIDGNVNGSVTAGGCVDCGTINGGVTAGDSVNSGNINGGVSAGDSVNCGKVNGNIDAGDGVSCGNVSGNVTAGDGISCGNIEGDVKHCTGDIHCHDIRGSVHCEGKVIYEK